ERYRTLLNGMPFGDESTLRRDDVLQCGKMVFKVDFVEEHVEPAPAAVLGPPPREKNGEHIRTSGCYVKVQASARRSWDEALEALTREGASRPRQGQHLRTLLRTGQHLCHLSSLDELLNSILEDAVQALDAQRGSIVLADPASGNLQLRAALAPRLKGRHQ